jgi:hypothetical protein
LQTKYFRPEVSEEELHPEEGRVPSICANTWQQLVSAEGLIQDDLALRKVRFQKCKQLFKNPYVGHIFWWLGPLSA